MSSSGIASSRSADEVCDVNFLRKDVEARSTPAAADGGGAGNTGFDTVGEGNAEEAAEAAAEAAR